LSGASRNGNAPRMNRKEMSMKNVVISVMLSLAVALVGCTSVSENKRLQPPASTDQDVLENIKATKIGIVPLPQELAPFVGANKARVAWITDDPKGQAVDAKTNFSDLFDIVVIEKGNLPEDVSIALRAYLENGGIIWTFDRAFASTWRNKALLGGLIPGADKGWEPPENGMVWVQGVEVVPADDKSAIAKGVPSVKVGPDHSMMTSLDGKDLRTGLTTFDRAMGESCTAILKAQKVGEAVIGQQSFKPGRWVVVGLAAKVGKGQVVILPSLDYSDDNTSRFLGNLVEWCIKKDVGNLASARQSEEPRESSTSPVASNVAREVVGIATYETSRPAPESAVFQEQTSSEHSAQAAAKVVKVTFDTSQGTFVVEVHRDWAPKGADRFLELVNMGYYDGNRFFRAVPGFVVQWGIAGDPALSKQWMHATIEDDPVKKANAFGTIAFAATGIPNTRSSQVFINLNGNTQLDSMRFAPFGQVISGMDVVEKLNSRYGEKPVQEQILEGGNEWLDKTFPGLDYVKTATIEQASAFTAYEVPMFATPDIRRPMPPETELAAVPNGETVSLPPDDFNAPPDPTESTPPAEIDQILPSTGNRTPSKMESRGLAEKLVKDGAKLLDKQGDWIDEVKARPSYDALKELDGNLVTDVIVRKVEKDENRLHVLFLAVKLGIPGSEKRLNGVLEEFGDKSMAEDFLNSGSEALYEGGKNWANRHGYSINTGPGSHRVAWGRF